MNTHHAHTNTTSTGTYALVHTAFHRPVQRGTAPITWQEFAVVRRDAGARRKVGSCR